MAQLVTSLVYRWRLAKTRLSSAHITTSAPLSNSGSAYVFVRNGTTWTQQQKLTASGTADDEFGISVGIAGEVFRRSAFRGPSQQCRCRCGVRFSEKRNGVGAHAEAHSENRSISRACWSPSEDSAQSCAWRSFGESLAVSGDRLVVGASRSTSPTAAGAVYVFVDGGGQYALQQKLTILGGTMEMFSASLSPLKAIRW